VVSKADDIASLV